MEPSGRRLGGVNMPDPSTQLLGRACVQRLMEEYTMLETFYLQGHEQLRVSHVAHAEKDQELQLVRWPRAESRTCQARLPLTPVIVAPSLHPPIKARREIHRLNNAALRYQTLSEHLIKQVSALLQYTPAEVRRPTGLGGPVCAYQPA